LSDWFNLQADDKTVRREREKARALRKSNWWKARLAEGRCHYCGRIFKPEELTMDHVVPVARGGRSSKGNVVPCCKPCNSRKKLMTPVDMILQQLEEAQRPDPAEQ
jgi:5-methylcytosine-specific restriction endonuclease McrA